MEKQISLLLTERETLLVSNSFLVVSFLIKGDPEGIVESLQLLTKVFTLEEAKEICLSVTDKIDKIADVYLEV